MFQRKVYKGAIRTLTEYRRHLDGRSSDTADENRHRRAWLSLRDCGCQKKPLAAISQTHSVPDLAAVGAVAFASQIRGHIRAELTCDVGYAFDPVKISPEAFRPTTLVAVGSFEVRRSRVEKVELSTPSFVAVEVRRFVFPVTNRSHPTTSGMRNLSDNDPAGCL
jgi:hypothetical protein